MYTLGIDTSNYATSLAVFDTAAEEVVCDRKRFLPVKPGELGLRQSDAVFHHTAALPELLRELDAEFPLHRVDAVGVSEKPRPVEGSYMPCFLTGLAVAQGLALARGVPLVRTTHQQGHIQNLPYEEQLRFKTGQVRDQLARIGKIALPEIAPCLGSARTQFYRNKLEFTFADRRWLTREEIESAGDRSALIAS